MAMTVRYAHTNIIADDWKALADFYIAVFDCKPVPPERDQSGEWLETATGVRNASLRGMHLRLPGHGDDGPTLEIYTYAEMLEKPAPLAANRKGLGHLAFEVDDVRTRLAKLVGHGGQALGQMVTKEVPGVGEITVVYAADPEGNIIELQSWKMTPA